MKDQSQLVSNILVCYKLVRLKDSVSELVSLEILLGGGCRLVQASVYLLDYNLDINEVC